MDRAFREDQIGRANQRAIRRTALLDGLDREYTLNEIAIITRAAPARRLACVTRATSGSALTRTSRSTTIAPIVRRCSRLLAT